MKEPNKRLEGKSFIWAFFVSLALFSCAAIWGGKVGLSKNFCLIMLAISGYIPILIVFFTGYGFDGMWVARYSRIERPAMYWFSFAISVFLAIFVSFAAYSLYIQGNKSVT